MEKILKVHISISKYVNSLSGWATFLERVEDIVYHPVIKFNKFGANKKRPSRRPHCKNLEKKNIKQIKQKTSQVSLTDKTVANSMS